MPRSLSPTEAGSDVAAMRCAAKSDGDGYVLDGEKTFISNGGIADFYVVFARTGEADGARGLSALIVDAGVPGFEIAERIEVIAPHPLARLRFVGCRVPKSQLLGNPGQGFKIAMQTLDIFRTSVAAAALGSHGGRLMRQSLARETRRMFNQATGGLSNHPDQACTNGHPGGRAPHCSLIAPLGSATKARTSRVKRRWPR